MLHSCVLWFLHFCSCRWVYWLTSVSDVFSDAFDHHSYIGYISTRDPYESEEEEDEDEKEIESEEEETHVHAQHKSFKGLIEQGVLEHGTIVVCKKNVAAQGVVRVAGKKYGIEYQGVVHSYTDFLKVVNNGIKGNPWKLLYTIDEDGGLLDSFETLWDESYKQK